MCTMISCSAPGAFNDTQVSSILITSQAVPLFSQSCLSEIFVISDTVERYVL